jgi:hypothetical protein
MFWDAKTAEKWGKKRERERGREEGGEKTTGERLLLFKYCFPSPLALPSTSCPFLSLFSSSPLALCPFSPWRKRREKKSSLFTYHYLSIWLTFSSFRQRRKSYLDVLPSGELQEMAPQGILTHSSVGPCVARRAGRRAGRPAAGRTPKAEASTSVAAISFSEPLNC